MKAKGWEQATRLNGKVYFVVSARIDEPQDAHVDDVFCIKLRKAKVVGEVKNGHIVAGYFTLLHLNESR